MSIVGLSGKPIKSRQQQREEARNMQGQVVASTQTVEQIKQNINFLLYRTDVIFEIFRAMGITQEQFDEVEAKVQAQYAETRARMGAQQAGGEQ